MHEHPMLTEMRRREAARLMLEGRAVRYGDVRNAVGLGAGFAGVSGYGVGCPCPPQAGAGVGYDFGDFVRDIELDNAALTALDGDDRGATPQQIAAARRDPIRMHRAQVLLHRAMRGGSAGAGCLPQSGAGVGWYGWFNMAGYPAAGVGAAYYQPAYVTPYPFQPVYPHNPHARASVQGVGWAGPMYSIDGIAEPWAGDPLSSPGREPSPYHTGYVQETLEDADLPLVVTERGGHGFRVEDEPHAGRLGTIVVPDNVPEHALNPEHADRRMRESEWREYILAKGYPAFNPRLIMGPAALWQQPGWAEDQVPAVYDTGSVVWLIVSDNSNPDVRSNRTLTTSQVRHRLQAVSDQSASTPLSDWLPVPVGGGFWSEETLLAAALAPASVIENPVAAQAIDATFRAIPPPPRGFIDFLKDVLSDPLFYGAIALPIPVKIVAGVWIPIGIPLAVYGLWKARGELKKAGALNGGVSGYGIGGEGGLTPAQRAIEAQAARERAAAIAAQRARAQQTLQWSDPSRVRWARAAREAQQQAREYPAPGGMPGSRAERESRAQWEEQGDWTPGGHSSGGSRRLVDSKGNVVE